MCNVPEMPADDPPPPDVDDGRDDCFAPPAEPCECYCLHCQRVVLSDQMWYQAVVNGPPHATGFWMCPTPNCGGAGFTFDIFPTDPNHPANAGWTYSDDDEDGDQDEGTDELPGNTDDAEYDPAEPQYGGDGPEDDEGEEWKHGLQPGERPAGPSMSAEARAAWEAEQRKYDEPDRRPRTIDGSDQRPKPTWSDDDGTPPF
jgi:hypothetical protein